MRGPYDWGNSQAPAGERALPGPARSPGQTSSAGWGVAIGLIWAATLGRMWGRAHTGTTYRYEGQPVLGSPDSLGQRL